MASFTQPKRDVVQLEGKVLGEISPLCKKLIVGMDFGTAYSGIAYAYKAQPGTIHYGAPTAQDMQTKVPTALLKMPDGKWLFGYDAENKYQQLLVNAENGRPSAQLFKGFKMVLKDKTSGSFDSLNAFSTAGQKHSLMDLITQALRILKEFSLEKVRTEFASVLNITDEDVQWVLTVPAIWTDFGKAFMRHAAWKAGLMDEEQSDRLMLVLEPEAASLAVQEGMMDYDILTTGSQFMVLDCGGGTIDITAHEVETVKPTMSMKTIAIPSGGAWGGENVNGLFKTFLRKLLTPAYFASKEVELSLEFHTIYTEFDRLKVHFNPTEEPYPLRLTDVLPPDKKLAELVEDYNNTVPAAEKITVTTSMRRGFLTMTNEIMYMFFNPLLDPIVDATRKVLREHSGIKFIIVVGGFGSSNVVRDRVFKEFDKKNGITCILPQTHPRPQGAIAHGAVFNGMYQTIVSSRVAPYTYGVGRHNDVFEVVVTKGDKLAYDHKVRLSGIPVTDSQTVCSWPVLRSDKKNPTKQSEEIRLGAITCPCPPAPTRNEREQTCLIEFGRTEIRVEIVNKAGEKTKGNVKMQ